MPKATTRVRFLVVVGDGEPQEVTSDLIEGLVRTAFENAQVPVQDGWINYQVTRAQKAWDKFTSVVGSLIK